MAVGQAIDLAGEDRKTVLALLERYLPGTEAWAYGSRVKWTSRPQSDLDLVVFAMPEQRRRVGDLREAFEESNLPFRVDLFVWDDVPVAFREQIRAEHVVMSDLERTTERCTLRRTAVKDIVDLRLSSVAGVHQQWCTLGDLAEIIMGQSPAGSTVNKMNGVPLLNGPTEFGSHHPRPLQYTSDPRKLAQPGDLLFCVRGATAGRMNWADQEYAIGRGIAAIRHRSSRDLQPFLEAAIKSGLPTLLAGTTGSVFRNVSASQLKGLRVPHFRLNRQRAIAHVLGTLDDKIELNRRMNATLEQMARALFRSWFIDFDPVRAKMEGRDTGLPQDIAKLFPDRLVDSELGEIPEGWEVKSLKNCMSLTMGQSPPGSTYNDRGEGLPFFQGRSDFGFRYPEKRRFCSAPKRIANPEDTLVSVRAPVGDINMAWETCCIGRGVAALKHRSGSTSFTYHSTWSMQQELRKYEQTGTVFGAINKGQLGALKVIEPDPKVVDAFDSLTRYQDAQVKSNVSESRTLAALRDALLPKLISGDIRVRDAERLVGASL